MNRPRILAALLLFAVGVLAAGFLTGCAPKGPEENNHADIRHPHERRPGPRSHGQDRLNVYRNIYH